MASPRAPIGRAEACVHARGRKIGEVMACNVLMVTEDPPLEQAVRLIQRNRVEATPSCQSVRRDGASGPVDIDWRVSNAQRLVHTAHRHRPAGGQRPRDHILRHFPRTQERRRRSHSVEIAVDFLRRIRWCGHQMAALPCSIQIAIAPKKKTVPKP